MEGTFRRYPIGIQSFERLRNDNCVYIDKTELIYRLASSAKACFLSRPRRFGKTGRFIPCCILISVSVSI